MIESTEIFEKARQRYTKFDGIYALGTFVNKNPRDMNQDEVQLHPLESTCEMFDVLYKNFDLGHYTKNQFLKDRALYTTNNEVARSFLKNAYGPQFSISAESAELLEGVGNTQPENTIRLIEAVDDDYKIYYIIIGGFPALETKSTEMKLAELEPVDGWTYNTDIFTMDENGGIAPSPNNLELLIIAMANDVFGRHISPNEITMATPLEQVGGNFFDLGLRTDDNDNRLLISVKTEHEWVPNNN